MKRLLAVLLVLFAALGLCGCGGKAGDTMYIEPAQLTEKEKDIADLLGLDTKQRIFDFSVDDTVQSVSIRVYQLIDGAWTLRSGGGGLAFADPEGRIALGFDDLTEGLRVAVQSESTGDLTAYEKETGDEQEMTGMGCTTSVLSDRTEIVYEKEIPLVIQIITAKNEIKSYVVDYFEHPEEYEKYGYEYVYAITVKFSQEPLS